MSAPNDAMKNSMKMQAQIRHNAEEMSTYLTDLQKWEAKAAKKDKEIGKTRPKVVKSVPQPVAAHVSSATPSSAPAATPLAEKGNELLTPASLVAMHSITEVAAAAVPKATGEVSAGGMEAKVREHGNNEYKKGNFVEAVKLYTKCIGLKSRNYIGFSNRAMAYLKMKDFVHGEKDCNSALSIEPSHIKSYIRRASARNSLGKHRGALQDLEYALDIIARFDDNNSTAGDSKVIKADILKTKEMLRNSVSHAPMVSIPTMWVEDIDQALLPDDSSSDVEASGPVTIAIEAGPDPRPLTVA
jgi:tetratricopeptide (TPR) repeat protein